MNATVKKNEQSGKFDLFVGAHRAGTWTLRAQADEAARPINLDLAQFDARAEANAAKTATLRAICERIVSSAAPIGTGELRAVKTALLEGLRAVLEGRA